MLNYTERGFVFDGLHSYRDMGLTIIGDIQISFPNKIKKKTRIPGTNSIIDHSNTGYGQPYEEREIKMKLNIIDFDSFDIISTHDVATKIMNWLLVPSKKARMEIDVIPSYYFLAELEDGNNLETDLFEIGEMELKFTAYPFKIRKKVEGDDDWDSFDFESDVAQDTTYYLPSLNDQEPLKPLSIGEKVTIGGWVASDSDSYIGTYQSAISYYITEIKPDRSAYKIDNGQWIKAEDIVQARDFLEIQLTNDSANIIFPKVYQSPSVGKGGITVELNGVYYNFRYDELTNGKNDKLNLLRGENKLRIYGENTEVSFEFHREVL